MTLKSPVRVEDSFANVLDFTSVATNANRLLSMLCEKGVIYIRGIEPTPQMLLRFGSQLGAPMAKLSFKHNTLGDPAFKYIGRISYRPDIAPSERADTDDCNPISIHTARSYVADRPDLFMFLMVDPGWGNLKWGLNGESILLDFYEFFEEYRSRFPTSADADMQLLSTVSIPFRPWYFNGGEIAHEPVLRRVGDKLEIRFWNDIENPENLLCAADHASRLQPVFERICKSIWESHSLRVFQMKPGDLYIINNRRFGHGRYGFCGSLEKSHKTESSSRQAYSLHVRL